MHEGRNDATGVTRVMGILNVTPDSFSDGGTWLDPARAVAHAEAMIDEGADVVDVGGESTRPGATPVDADEEIRRVVPVIAAIRARRTAARISIDTSKAAVADRAIEAGADMVNDVTALGDPGMAGIVARAGVEVVLMHMRGDPRTMQRDTGYADLVGEVERFLSERMERAMSEGVAREKILVDPGLGFGKEPADNVRLVAAVPRLRALAPVVIGASRKRFVGDLTGVAAPAERIAGSIGVALAAASLGADLVRVHDVGPTRHALLTFFACRP
jgi:dihydropteroate synthase